MTEAPEVNLFSIIDQQTGQMIIEVPGLYNNLKLGSILKVILLKQDAITDVQIDSGSNLVTIDFQVKQLPETNLLRLLKTVLLNFTQKPNKLIDTPLSFSCEGVDLQEFRFKIAGMSCESCALFIEMRLAMTPGIKRVKINFPSKTGIVQGYLGRDEVFKVIENSGYSPCCLDTR